VTASAAAGALAHDLDGCPRAVHDPEEIDGDDGLNHVVRLGCRVTGTQESGVVDPDIRLHRAGKGATRISIADVQMYVATRDIRGGDVVALRPQTGRDSGTEAAARAGHDSARHDITGH
jgi:hypothetical protein